MTDHLLTDEALKRVRYYNTDLDVDILWKKETEVKGKGLQADVSRVRSALVARIADIIKQNPTLPSALDTAVSMTEVLLLTSNHTTAPQSHKSAIQAISLLASSSARFATGVDLFFDLVDRYCASAASSETNICRLRTLQTYDQTFVKIFLSKAWAEGEGGLSVENALWRISCIRQKVVVRERWGLVMVRGRRVQGKVFGDSVEVLQGMRRRGSMTKGVFLGRVSPFRSGWSALGDVAGGKRRGSGSMTGESVKDRMQRAGSEGLRRPVMRHEIGLAIG